MEQHEDRSGRKSREKMTRRAPAQAASGSALLAAMSARGSAEAASGNSGDAFPDVQDLTRQVANFAARTTYADLPAEVIALGKKSLLDSIGLALCGSRSEVVRLARAYIATLRLPEGGATVIGSARKLAPRFAAFLNGIGIHCDDYDDTQLAVGSDRQYGLLTHPSTTVLPVALALAEVDGRSGARPMVAYHTGVEVECKIAEAMVPRHYEQGFHTTGTAGTFGAAVAAAKLRALDAASIARVLGVAGSSAAGLRENFGTTTKALHAGRAAEAGIVAADLVAIGWTASDQILESPRGFFRAAAGTYDPGRSCRSWGIRGRSPRRGFR